MLFNSSEFVFLFLPITLFAFFLIGQLGYYHLAALWLSASSLFFYGWWNPAYLFLLIVSILANYFLGSAISSSTKFLIHQRYLLIFGIIANLGLLGYFKYTDFLISTTNGLIGTSFNLQNIVLPLAISFFTFTQIAYLVDAYKGKAREYNFSKYFLFVVFFPHLIAGPIVHHDEIIPQFNRKTVYRFNGQDIAIGLTIFAIGLFKKVIIADTIAAYATPVFDAAAQGTTLTLIEAWGGALAYTFQLYFDFSGYSDMAIGSARMFGIKFPLNFNSPYRSANIAEFWRNWHITLSNFLRDYLYIPLGGNRKGKLRQYLNLMVTMLLGGLWHGAGWTFVIWGGLHGAYLVIHRQWQSLRKTWGHDIKQSSGWGRALGCLLTFVAVVVAWVFFRAENLEAAIAMLKGMVGANGISLVSSVPTAKQLLLLLLLLVWFTPNTQQWMSQHEPTLDPVTSESTGGRGTRLWKKLQWQPTTGHGIVIGVLIFIAIKTILAAPKTEFLYFNF